MKPIIFLDFDGVICTTRGHHPRNLFSTCDTEAICYRPDGDCWFSPSAIANLNVLCAETNADIVISSSWRSLYKFDQLVRCLVDHKVMWPIIGVTPDFIRPPTDGYLIYYSDSSSRGQEVQAWRVLNNRLDSPYVILDDTDDFLGLRDRLVLTDFHTGLTEADVTQAIKILER